MIDTASALSSISPTPTDQAVLVHCNEGHNRSPALVLSYLIRCGLSLRAAYKLVLRARPTIDPLPPYRHALWQQEQKYRTGSQLIPIAPSVRPEEDAFHWHISKLKQAILKTKEDYADSSSGATSIATKAL